MISAICKGLRTAVPRTAAVLFMVLLLGFANASGSPPGSVHRSYYPNGTIREKGHLLEGQKKGVWVYYNDQGIIEKKEKWKKGMLLWQMFFEKGKVTKVIDRDGKVSTRPACGC